MVRLYIIRHGDPDYETDRNLGGTLTVKGRAEAKSLQPFLKAVGITHAYTSPLKRARLTGEIALRELHSFSSNMVPKSEQDLASKINEQEGSVKATPTKCSTDPKKQDGKDNNEQKRTNFDLNVPMCDFLREITPWRFRWQQQFGSGWSNSVGDDKGRAIWDFPATMTREQLFHTVQGTQECLQGWTHSCPDHAAYVEDYRTMCRNFDSFLSEKHGIVRHGPSYRMSWLHAQHPSMRKAKIALFCHGGQGLALLSHLLAIPLPMVHSSMWLPTCSVTTILFEEYEGVIPNDICCRSQSGGSHDAQNKEKGKEAQDESSTTGLMDVNSRRVKQYIKEAQQPSKPLKSPSDCSHCNGLAIDEQDKASIIMVPRALCIGGTGHLDVAGIEINSSGLWRNFD